MRKHLRLMCVAFVLAAAGCDRDPIVLTTPTPTPAPTTPAPIADRIEYRVTGANVSSAVTIRFSDPANGLAITSSTLPFITTATSTDPSAFVFLEASGFGFSTSTLQVQIFVNGRVFREASAAGSVLFAQASGTIRH